MLVFWWLTYKLPVEREVDDAALGETANAVRWEAPNIAEIWDTFSVH
jgi:hypothetical protein